MVRSLCRPIIKSRASRGSSSSPTTPTTTSLPEPAGLWRNGSFGVFKMIEQDVVGFENFLQSNKDQIDPELLAAKICGRWRNGVPLALSPDTDSPAGGMTADAVERLRVCEQRRIG